MFVVQGNIIIPSSVGAVSTWTSPIVTGIFIANGSISIQSVGDPDPDLKFIGSGTFVAYGGITLARDFRGIDNNTSPSELFQFNPRLILNAPDSLKKAHYTWKQVAP